MQETQWRHGFNNKGQEAHGRIPGGQHGNPPSILAREIPWTKEPGGYSPWAPKESDMTGAIEHAHTTLSDKF